MHDVPWPVAPRPFEDEAFGSWFGRLALRYRMNVDELAGVAGVTLDFGQDCRRWLPMAPPVGGSLQRLAMLCRVSSEVLANLGAGTQPGTRPSSFGYCHACLFVNPVDVASPYWKASWLQDPANRCPLHDADFDYVRETTLADQRNFHRLLRFISRRRRLREARLRRYGICQR